MKSQGKNGSSLIERRVEASTTCVYTSSQPEPSGGGGEPEFLVQLKCVVTKYIRAGPGREQRLKRICRGANAEASFVGAVPRDVVVDDYEDCLRSVMRWLLREIRPLRDLDLTDDEWEAILPQDVLPQLADMVRGLDEGRSRAAAVVNLEVNRRVRYSTPQVLMSACTGAAPATATEGKDDGCSICLEALHEGAAAAGKGVPVELPGCAHAFHRRCISEWFGKKPTCPMCRGNVTNHLDPELQKDLLEFSHDEDADPHPHPPAVLDSSGNEIAAPPGDP